MKKSLWSLVRHVVNGAVGQQRWDQAVQYLVQWSAVSPKEPSQGESQQEGANESRDVCPRLHAAAGADADH